MEESMGASTWESIIDVDVDNFVESFPNGTEMNTVAATTATSDRSYLPSYTSANPYENDETARALKSLAIPDVDARWENARRLQIMNACSGIEEKLKKLLGDAKCKPGFATLIKKAREREIIGDEARQSMDYLRIKRNKMCHANCENPFSFTDEEILEKVKIINRALESSKAISNRLNPKKRRREKNNTATRTKAEGEKVKVSSNRETVDQSLKNSSCSLSSRSFAGTILNDFSDGLNSKRSHTNKSSYESMWSTSKREQDEEQHRLKCLKRSTSSSKVIEILDDSE